MQVWYILQNECHRQPCVPYNHSFHIISSLQDPESYVNNIVSHHGDRLCADWAPVVWGFGHIPVSLCRGQKEPISVAPQSVQAIWLARIEEQEAKIHNQVWFNRTDMPFIQLFFRTPCFRAPTSLKSLWAGWGLGPVYINKIIDFHGADSSLASGNPRTLCANIAHVNLQCTAVNI